MPLTNEPSDRMLNLVAKRTALRRWALFLFLNTKQVFVSLRQSLARVWTDGACHTAEEIKMKPNRKKLRLDLESLQVEAFATADSAAKNGTVYGYCDEPRESLSCISVTNAGPCMCLPPMSANGEC
jgi:hypothetical protein